MDNSGCGCKPKADSCSNMSQSSSEMDNCGKECNTYQKLSKAVDTTNLSDCVEQAEKAAKRLPEHPLKAELCKEEKCPNKCLSKMLDTNCLTKKVEAVEKVAGEVCLDKEKDCDCKMNWGDKEPAKVSIVVPKPDVGCGCKKCVEEAVKSAPVISVESQGVKKALAQVFAEEEEAFDGVW